MSSKNVLFAPLDFVYSLKSTLRRISVLKGKKNSKGFLLKRLLAGIFKNKCLLSFPTPTFLSGVSCETALVESSIWVMQTTVIVRCKDELKSCHSLGSIFIFVSLVQWGRSSFLPPFTWRMTKPVFSWLQPLLLREKNKQTKNPTNTAGMFYLRGCHPKSLFHALVWTLWGCAAIQVVLPSKCQDLHKFSVAWSHSFLHLWSTFSCRVLMSDFQYSCFSLPFSIFFLILCCFVFVS